MSRRIVGLWLVGVVAVVALVICAVLGAISVFHPDTNGTDHLQHLRVAERKGLPADLQLSDRDLQLIWLRNLRLKNDPSGTEQALKLLQSSDNYLWLAAALYLGELGEAEAVPYLIKGLKHPATRSREDVARLLRMATGEELGQDQAAWIRWWKTANPGSEFSFEYLDLQNAAASLREKSFIPITSVIDPLRISHVGVPIRLIGIRLRNPADKERAIALLQQLLILQYVELEFDEGKRLDEDGACRALLHWTRSSPACDIQRRSYPPIPFSRRTLINTYLLHSDMYEFDSNSVCGEAVQEVFRPHYTKDSRKGSLR